MKIYNIAINNLQRRKAKMMFLMLGLVIGVSTVVTLITVSRAMNKDIGKNLDEFGANILIVPKSDDISLSYGGMSVSGVSFDVQQLQQEDVQKIRTIKNKENITIIAPKLLNAVKVQNKSVLTVGVDFQEELRLKKWWSIIGSVPHSKTEVIVGSEVKNILGLVVNNDLEINGKQFSVAGILEPTGSQDDGIIFLDLETAQQLFNKTNQLNLIEVAALCYDCPIEEIVRQTSEKLPGAKVTAIRQTIESKMEAMHRFEHFSFGISAVILFIGALIVFTIMTGSVNERTREIGIFRAIGFRQAQIMKIIFTEALLTSLLAGVLGYAIGFGVSKLVAPAISMNSAISLPVDFILFGFSTVLAIFIGLASTVYPAYRASRMDPTVALRAL
ncbi:MAG: FtsX-like permease family protein [Bacteroidota bacterium]